jgi:hypothetical protein
MTIYLFKVHLQTFLSIPITKKCQILSCDTLVANERYVHIFACTSQFRDAGRAKEIQKIGAAVNDACRTFASFAINTFAGIDQYRFGRLAISVSGISDFRPH